MLRNLDHLVVDPQRRRWIRNRRVDLLAANTPIVSQGKFIIFSETIPDGSVVVVKGFVPYACERTNPGNGESFQYLDPLVANGWFSYEPVVNVGAPYEILLDVNAPTLAAGTLNNNERQASAGLTEVSREPWRDASVQWNNPLFSFVVPGGAKLEVFFQLLSNIHQAAVSPMTDIYAISVGAGPPDTKRVDFAGCLIVGEILPESLYRELVERSKKEARLG